MLDHKGSPWTIIFVFDYLTKERKNIFNIIYAALFSLKHFFYSQDMEATYQQMSRLKICDIYIQQNTLRTSLVAQMVKNLPAICEIWVLSLGQEETLEKEMETHSSILA